MALVAVLGGVVVLSSACARPPASGGADGRVKVVAAENFWGDIARQIGGDRVDVTSIVSNPNTDPHLYESSAADAAAVAGANIVIVNGLGYDDFMSRLVAGSGAHPAVVTVQRVLGVSGSGANPHLWYDVPRAGLVAKAIEQALVRADPSGAKTYAANLDAFDASLKPLLAVVATIRAKYPNAPVAYTERVPGYLVDAAGLRVVSPPGFPTAIENGTDPAPADVQAMSSLLAKKQVRVLLYNTQAVSAVTKRVLAQARAAGVPVVGVTETMPSKFPSYQAWQLDQAKQVLAALGG